MIRISEPVAALLDLIQFRQGVSIEVLDTSLRPAQPARQGEFAGAVEEPAIRAQCLVVLRTGESRIDGGRAAPVAIYPLRLDREISGLILVTRSAGRATPRADGDEAQTLQTVGLMGRAILEDDLSRTRQLARESERIRRLQGILRFLGQLKSMHGADMMQAVVQAATVWFDLDCRLYHGGPDGNYALLAALPGVEPPEVRQHLDGQRLREICAARHVTSVTDLEFLSGAVRRGSALVLGAGLDDEVVCVLIGSIDSEVELTFTAITQAIGGELQLAARARLSHWQRRLAVRAAAPDVAHERILLQMIEELCVLLGAAGGRVSIQRGDVQRTVAALDAGGEAGERLTRVDPERSHQRVVPVGPGVRLHLEVWGRAEPFTFEPLAEIDAWGQALVPWVAVSNVMGGEGIPASDSEEAAFERLVHQEVERAKRFDLGLALVLIEPAGAVPAAALSDVVRAELRASDLYGPVRGGRMAVVLVHSGPEGARSVVRRIGEKLTGLFTDTRRTAARLGQAVFSSEVRSGEALIAEALLRLDEPRTRS
jgi:hypothetical protein